MIRVLVSAALAIACVSLMACDDSIQPPTEEKFDGILRMDPACTILGGDTTDFMPRPSSANNALAGACPNPTDGATSVHFQIIEADSVWILAYDRPGGAPVDTLFNRGNAMTGSYMVTWLSPNGPGIFRIVMRTAKGFHSYGDVEFTEQVR